MNSSYKYLETDKLEGLECAICLDILLDPILESSCGQMFCSQCLNKAKKIKSTCPLCNSEIKEVVVSRYILNILNETLVSCTICNNSNQDDKPIKRCDFKNHILNDCKSKTCQYCNSKLSNSEFDHHLLEICLFAPVNCKGKKVLCPFTSTRDNVILHELTCNYLQLEPVLCNLLSEISNLKDENKQLTAQLNNINNNNNNTTTTTTETTTPPPPPLTISHTTNNSGSLFSRIRNQLANNKIEENNNNNNKTSKKVLVYFDIKIGSESAGRIIMELFKDDVPITVENFRCLCTGEKGISRSTRTNLTFKNNIFHRIVPDFICQAGDITHQDGRGGESIYGINNFKDENFKFKHLEAGTLSMANTGPNSNTSQFFITLKPTEWLDGKHVVFGRVTSGMDVLKKMESVGSDTGKTLKSVVIYNCGQIS